jgi:hypothetical protein
VKVAVNNNEISGVDKSTGYYDIEITGKRR